MHIRVPLVLSRGIKERDYEGARKNFRGGGYVIVFLIMK
jgi:hypothetical protein